MFEQVKFQEMVETGPEVLLYFLINEMGGFIWRMNHDMADGRIPEADHPAIDKDLVATQKQIEFAVDHTTRFGVETPRVEGRASPDYWKWFRWWDTYVKGLSDEDFDLLDKALGSKEGLEKWRPAGDWR